MVLITLIKPSFWVADVPVDNLQLITPVLDEKYAQEKITMITHERGKCIMISSIKTCSYTASQRNRYNRTNQLGKRFISRIVSNHFGSTMVQRSSKQNTSRAESLPCGAIYTESDQLNCAITLPDSPTVKCSAIDSLCHCNVLPIATLTATLYKTHLSNQIIVVKIMTKEIQGLGQIVL